MMSEIEMFRQLTSPNSGFSNSDLFHLYPNGLQMVGYNAATDMSEAHQAPIESQCGWLRIEQDELFFEWAGEGDPVVFLHGFGLDLRMWNPQFERFQSRFRVVRYDLRGFGRSTLPSVSEYAHEDDLKALLMHLRIRSAHIVGLSMGGRMALRFAAAHPQMVKSLVLADSAVDGHAWSPEWQRRWKAMCDSAKADRIDDAKRQWLQHPLFAPARAIPSCALLLSTMIDDYGGWHWQGRDTARTPSPALAKRLQEIRLPSLVITGSIDIPDFQAIGNLLATGLPRMRREIIEGSGHMVNLEAPESFNKVLSRFWQELS